MKTPEMAWITQINYTFILSVYSVKAMLLSILWISWNVMSSATSVTEYMWIFCARAPSGVQYDWKRHYVFSANGQSNY